MSPRKPDPVERGGGDGVGLPGSSTNGPTQGVPGDIMAWKRSDPAVVEQRAFLPISLIGDTILRNANDGHRPEGPAGKSRAVTSRRVNGPGACRGRDALQTGWLTVARQVLG